MRRKTTRFFSSFLYQRGRAPHRGAMSLTPGLSLGTRLSLKYLRAVSTPPHHQTQFQTSSPRHTKKSNAFQHCSSLCDPGEARTLDPMIKSHLLYQLSYGVNVLLISVAKVRAFLISAKFSGNYFSRNFRPFPQPSPFQRHSIQKKLLRPECRTQQKPNSER